MDVKDTLQKIKALFADAPPVSVPDQTPLPNMDNSNIVSYSVVGGQPVFVNISDDDIADIDQGDNVYTDAAMTTPYPDGTYKVDGDVDFSFTVAGGVVTSISDPDDKGAGTPNGADANNTVEPNGANSLFAEQFAAFKTEFSNKMAEMETIKTAFKTVQSDFSTYKIQANEKLQKQGEAIQQLLNVVEALSKVPTSDPLQKPTESFKADKFERKEEKMKQIAEQFRKLKEEKINY